MTNLLISDAWAQAGGGGGSSLFSLLPLALIFVLFYFLLIRPQQRRAKQHKQMVAAIKAGDEVATNGGLLGRVTDLDDNCVTLKVATGVNVQVQRHAIAQMVPKGVFKEFDGGGKKSKGAGKQSKGAGKPSKESVNEPTAQVAETPPADEIADATFEESSDQDDATFENPDKTG
jgi:preprotein translocase subunit YajC